MGSDQSPHVAVGSFYSPYVVNLPANAAIVQLKDIQSD